MNYTNLIPFFNNAKDYEIISNGVFSIAFEPK